MFYKVDSWLPRHFGIEGNELADKLANAATAWYRCKYWYRYKYWTRTVRDVYLDLGKWQIGKRQDGLCNHCSKSETVSDFLTEFIHRPTCIAVLAACKRLNLTPTLDIIILSDSQLYSCIWLHS